MTLGFVGGAKARTVPCPRVARRWARFAWPTLLQLLQQIPESLPRQAGGFGGGGVDLGKLVAPVPGPAGVDDGAAVGEIALGLALGLDARVERRAPGVVGDVDG